MKNAFSRSICPQESNRFTHMLVRQYSLGDIKAASTLNHNPVLVIQNAWDRSIKLLACLLLLWRTEVSKFGLGI